MPDSAVILAGGLSSRYGKNKILEIFNGRTLIDHSIEFCMCNGISKIVIVYFDDQISSYLSDKCKQDLLSGKMKLVKRPVTPIGTGMSLRIGAEYAGERFIVLFGDNFYSGTFDDDLMSNVATSVRREASSDNLRFAAIRNEKIIEKPHAFDSGLFFAGYMILNRKDVLCQPLQVSKRGEVEITDIFNSCIDRVIVPLAIRWEEITYESDYPKMLDFIQKDASLKT